MTLNGAPYEPRDPREARQAGVAMIYQELSLAPHLSVMDNIALGVEPSRQGALGAFGIVHRDAVRRSARAALEQLGHSDIPARHAGRRAVARGAAAGGDRARAGIRLPRARARRADEQPRARRRTEAVPADPPAQATGPGNRVHLALHRRGDAGIRPLRRVARRPQCRRRRHHSGERRSDCQPDGRTRARRPVSARPAYSRRTAACGSTGSQPRAAQSGVVHAASRRDSRHRRFARRRPYAAASRPLRTRRGEKTDR